MPDLRHLVRAHLPELAVSPERENEIVAELATLLEEYAEVERIDLSSESEVRAWLRRQMPEWLEMVQEIDRIERPLTSRLAPTGAAPDSSPGRPLLMTIASQLDQLRQNFRLAVRYLAKNRGLTAMAVITLATAIGLNSAVFSVVNAVLLKPLQVFEPHRLASIYSEEPGDFAQHELMSFPDFEALAERGRAFAQMAVHVLSPLALETAGESQVVLGGLVSGSYFSTLGVRPAIGRSFSADDDAAGKVTPVAVLSHASWQSRFGADPGLIGRVIRLNGQPYTVVGVAPAGFVGLTRGFNPEVWIPVRTAVTLGAGPLIATGNATPGLDRLHDPMRRWVWVIGRLADEISLDQAAAEVEAIGAQLKGELPSSNGERGFILLATDSIRVLPDLDATLFGTSMVLMGLVAMVLLIACSNIANMLLARAIRRHKEIATRLALGASRWSVVRQLLVESLLLSLLGGGLGLLLALAASRTLGQLELPLLIQPGFDLSPDFRVLLFTFGAASLTALIFGLAPALTATRVNLSLALQSESRGSQGSRGRSLLRKGLVVSQVALSMMLLIFAALSLRSMHNAHNIDPGFDPDGVVVARFAPYLHAFDEDRTHRFYDQIGERAASLPSALSVGRSMRIPLSFEVNFENVAALGSDTGSPERWPRIDTNEVDSSFFATMRIPLLKGRIFNDHDTVDSLPVAVINETMAANLWPGRDAIGQQLRIGGREDSVEVVGVVRDGKYRTLGEAPRPFLYLALDQRSPDAFCLLVRHRGSSDQALAAIRACAREIEPDIATYALATMEESIGGALLLPRIGSILFGLFGGVGLLLATVGISGLIAHSVSQRTHEIGIRMAIGAQPRDILAMTIREGVKLACVGVVVGTAGAALSSRLLSAVLYGISAVDPLTFVAIPAFLVAVGVVASYLPARRALRVSPIDTLR